MIEIDLHGLAVTEALVALTSKYNGLVGSSQKELLVVHGYGSSGVGGVLRKRVRRFLKEAGVEFFAEQEDLRCNKGQTLVRVGKHLLTVGQGLEREMLKFCQPAKTKEKIFSKFHKRGQDALQQAFSALLKKGMLKESWKGKHKVYQGKS